MVASRDGGGAISHQYAAELGRQIDELEAENEWLRTALGEIDGRRRVPPYLTREEMILVARAALDNQQLTQEK